MKNTIITLLVIMFMSGVVLTGCQSSAKKVENAENKVEEAKENVMEAEQNLYNVRQDSITEYQKFKYESEERINSLDSSIAEFKARLAREKKIDDAKFKMKLAKLEQKNREMRMKLNNYKEEGQDKWISFKNEFIRDFDELGKAFKDLTVKND